MLILKSGCSSLTSEYSPLFPESPLLSCGSVFSFFFISLSSPILVLHQASMFTAAFSPLVVRRRSSSSTVSLSTLHGSGTAFWLNGLQDTPHHAAASKRPLAEKARLIYRLEGRKQVWLGLDLFQGFDYNGNLEEGRGLIGMMSSQASVHQVDV